LTNSSIVIASRDQRRGDPEKWWKPAAYGLPRSLTVARNDTMIEVCQQSGAAFSAALYNMFVKYVCAGFF